MAQQSTKHIGQSPASKPVSRMDTLHDTWTVMKPFVHFSIKAAKVIAHALVLIVKHIPKPDEFKTKETKNDKAVKI